MAVDHVDERPYAGVALAVDVQPGIGERLEQLVERRDRFGSGDSDRGQLAGGEIGDPFRTLAQPHEILVVEDDDHSIGADAYIGLQVAVPEIDGVAECTHRVLRSLGAAAPMGESDRGRPVEVRMADGHAGSMVAIMSERVFERANQQYGAFRSVVHRLSPPMIDHVAMVHQ